MASVDLLDAARAANRRVRCAALRYRVAMARMTPAEATAVNNVISYLVGTGNEIPDHVAQSLQILASRAYNRLQSGWHEDTVASQWPSAFPGYKPRGW